MGLAKESDYQGRTHFHPLRVAHKMRNPIFSEALMIVDGRASRVGKLVTVD